MLFHYSPALQKIILDHGISLLNYSTIIHCVMSGQISHKKRFLNLGLTSNLILLRLDAWATSSKHIRHIDPWTRMVGSERKYLSKYAIHAMGCVTYPQSPRLQHDFFPRFKVLKLRIAFVSLAKTSWLVSRDCGELWCHGDLYACNRKIKMHYLKIYDI